MIDATGEGVYRTRARSANEDAGCGLAWRRLSSSIGPTVAIVAVVIRLAHLHALGAMTMAPGERFVPTIEIGEDMIAVSLVAAVPWLIVVLRRVVPTWKGLGSLRKIAYLTALLVSQLAVIGAAEIAILAMRGGIHLFEPTYRSSFAGPEGLTAHVYAGGLLGCTYDVYVAERFAPTMKRQLSISRNSCSERVAGVRFNADKSVSLVRRDGTAMESQSTPSLFFGGGC